jgi:hypothetical protein
MASSKGQTSANNNFRMEAALVRQHVRALVDAGMRPDDIAVVTPYNAQVGTHIRIPLVPFRRAALYCIDIIEAFMRPGAFRRCLLA